MVARSQPKLGFEAAASRRRVSLAARQTPAKRRRSPPPPSGRECEAASVLNEMTQTAHLSSAWAADTSRASEASRVVQSLRPNACRIFRCALSQAPLLAATSARLLLLCQNSGLGASFAFSNHCPALPLKRSERAIQGGSLFSMTVADRASWKMSGNSPWRERFRSIEN